MTNHCCNKITFKNVPKKINFDYCGTPYMSANEVNVKLLELKQSLQNENQKRLDDVLENIQNAYTKLVNDFNDQIPAYLIKLLELILPKIKIEKNTLMALMEQVLQTNASENKIVLYISDKDQSVFEECKDQIKERYPNLILNIDTALVSGDVVLKTDFGMLDNRIQSRLKTIKEHWGEY